jgi:hypothetical protein
MNSITDAESIYIGEHLKCPDCREGGLDKGPSGGACMNVRCNKCGSRFNISAFGYRRVWRLNWGFLPYRKEIPHIWGERI